MKGKNHFNSKPLKIKPQKKHKESEKSITFQLFIHENWDEQKKFQFEIDEVMRRHKDPAIEPKTKKKEIQ